jgi:N-acetylgalactosamine 6-sulfate sulfatase (GALNS)
MQNNIDYPMFGEQYAQRKDYSADLIHQHALNWLKRQSNDKPFFGVFTYTLPHAELAQPNDSLLAFYKKKFFEDKTWGGQEGSRYNAVVHTHAQFAAMITRLDAYVGEILRTLDEQGLAENTLVIFTSDNGPHEEGGADPAFFNRDGKLRGVKRQCYEGGIRIPFIARWKGRIKEDVTSDLPFAFYDLMPTFCDVAGVRNFPKRYVNKKKAVDYFDGISIFPTLMSDDKAQKKHPHLYWEFAETNQIAVRMGDWKLIVIRGVPHLYNLATDLHEDKDIAQEHPEIVEQMVKIIYQEHVDNPLFPITMPKGKEI